MSSNIPAWVPSDIAKHAFVSELKNNQQLQLLNLATTDGFRVCQVARQGLNIEGDKIAAVTSSIMAMSNSAARAVFSEDSQTIDIESNFGKIVIETISSSHGQLVITLCCQHDCSLATARFIARRLRQTILQAL